MMLQWHISHYAYLMQKLKDTPEAGGTVLDNSVLVFTSEAGHGRQLNDGVSDNATHSVENMAMLIGGHAGGLVTGQHIRTDRAHPAPSTGQCDAGGGLRRRQPRRRLSLRGIARIAG